MINMAVSIDVNGGPIDCGGVQVETDKKGNLNPVIYFDHSKLLVIYNLRKYLTEQEVKPIYLHKYNLRKDLKSYTYFGIVQVKDIKL